MFNLLIFLSILSILILVHEFGHFIMAKKMGVRVEEFSLGFGTVLFRKKKKDTEYNISIFPLGGFIKMAGDSLKEYTGKPDEYFSKSLGQRFWIIFCGPLLNYCLGILFLWAVFFTGYPALTTKVGGLIEGLGAQGAGIQVGDKITAIDGAKVEYWEDLQKIIYLKKKADFVRVSLLRADKELTLSVRIQERQLKDRIGQKRSFGLLGITPFQEAVKVRYGFLRAFILSLDKAKDLTVTTYRALGLMITGQLSMRESMTGPLGIFFITSQAAGLGIIALLHLMAVLSLSLAIFNLLPFPILDGGHLALLGLEKIRGRPLGFKAEETLNKIGLAFIMSLAVLVTYNDIVKNFGDKLSKIFIK